MQKALVAKEEGSMNVAYPSKIPFGNSNSDIGQAFLEKKKELRKYCSYRYFFADYKYSEAC
jgi:hypothetical protein